MSTLEQDLAQLNFEYLMLARECARSNPLEAAWRFGLDSKQTRYITDLTVEKIKDMSVTSRAVISLLPMNTPERVSLTLHSALLIPGYLKAENT